MTDTQLKTWLLSKLDNCYPVKHHDYPTQIFWYYDESYIRKMKLSKINNTEATIQKNIKGYCLFEQDMDSKILWCHNNIWHFLEVKYNESYGDIQRFVMNTLCDHIRFKNYRAYTISFDQMILTDYDNLYVHEIF